MSDAVSPSECYLGTDIDHVGIISKHVGPDRTRLKIEVVFVAQTKTPVADVRGHETERLAGLIASKANAGAHVEVELEVARKRIESRENHRPFLEVDLFPSGPVIVLDCAIEPARATCASMDFIFASISASRCLSCSSSASLV